MTSTPTIDADAAGITDVAHARTGSVVDRLIAPDVAATADTIVHVPVKYVVPHPRNRKVLDDDVADLVAEFKAGVPILNPLGVTAAADWNANRPAELKEIGPAEFIITAGGHRRLRAAELAGLPTVPCIVRADFAGAEGRKAALLENLHRQDLDPFEEASAFEELTGPPYKLSQRELAAVVGVNQSHISKRLKLLKLPSTIREKVRLKKMSLNDALEITRVVDDKDLLKATLARISQNPWGDVKRHVEYVIEEAARARKRQEKVDELTADGVTLLDRAPEYYPGRGSEPCRLAGLNFTPAKHKKEPCHAAYVAQTYSGAEVVWACTAPKRHMGKKPDSKLATKTTAASASRGQSDAEKAQKRRRAVLRKTIDPARIAIVAQLLAGGFDAQTRRDIVTQSVIFRMFGGYSSASIELAVELLGIRPANTNAYLHSVLEEHVKTAKPEQMAVTGALAYFETNLRGAYSYRNPADRWYFEMLERNGYVLTAEEHEMLGHTLNDDGIWSQPTDDEDAGPHPDDGPTCRICFAFMDTLPDGVTAVADDLCSACSDAADAGWMEPTPDAAGFIKCMECDHGQPAEDCACTYCACNPTNVDEPLEAATG